MCGAASAGSDDLHRLDQAFIQLAEYIGVKLAPRDNPDKTFGPSTCGVVFGIHYDTVSWTWAIPPEKLARILEQLKEALQAECMGEKEVKSLVGKLIHIKPLIPAARFNVNHIMRWLALSNLSDRVAISEECKKQLQFWRDMLLTCNQRMTIPDTISEPPPWAINVYCDAAGGTLSEGGRGSGGVCGPLWYFCHWPHTINSGRTRWQGKKVGRKLTALELMGPLIFLCCAPDAFRRQQAVFWIDNAGSVAVWEKGYSPHCTMSTVIVKAIATVAAGIGCTVTLKKITRCSNTGAKLADLLSKSDFQGFFTTADVAGWQLTQDPLPIPLSLIRWLSEPSGDIELCRVVYNYLTSKTAILDA